MSDAMWVIVATIIVPLGGGIIRLLLDVNDMKNAQRVSNRRLERIERRLKLNGFSHPHDDSNEGE